MTFFTSITRGSEAHKIAKQIQAENQKNQEEIDRLNNKIEKLNRICQCLWQIVSERFDLDDEILMEQIKKLEEEAQLNSKMPPVECPSCKRPIHPSKKRCIFCCTEQPNNNNRLFDSL